jgi:hypothetical protein
VRLPGPGPSPRGRVCGHVGRGWGRLKGGLVPVTRRRAWSVRCPACPEPLCRPLLWRSGCSAHMEPSDCYSIPTGTSKCPPSQRVPALTGTTASNSDLASLFGVLSALTMCYHPFSSVRAVISFVATVAQNSHVVQLVRIHSQLGYGERGQFSTLPSACEITLPHTEKADHELLSMPCCFL